MGEKSLVGSLAASLRSGTNGSQSMHAETCVIFLGAFLKPLSIFQPTQGSLCRARGAAWRLGVRFVGGLIEKESMSEKRGVIE